MSHPKGRRKKCNFMACYTVFQYYFIIIILLCSFVFLVSCFLVVITEYYYLHNYKIWFNINQKMIAHFKIKCLILWPFIVCTYSDLSLVSITYVNNSKTNITRKKILKNVQKRRKNQCCDGLNWIGLQTKPQWIVAILFLFFNIYKTFHRIFFFR